MIQVVHGFPYNIVSTKLRKHPGHYINIATKLKLPVLLVLYVLYIYGIHSIHEKIDDIVPNINDNVFIVKLHEPYTMLVGNVIMKMINK